MITELNEEQYRNAASPMEDTVSPMVTELNEEQSLYAQLPMEVTELPIMTDVIAVAESIIRNGSTNIHSIVATRTTHRR